VKKKDDHEEEADNMDTEDGNKSPTHNNKRAKVEHKVAVSCSFKLESKEVSETASKKLTDATAKLQESFTAFLEKWGTNPRKLEWMAKVVEDLTTF